MLIRTIFGAAILLVANLGLAQSNFQEMDEDGDGSISKDEYYGYIGDAGIYADWDTDADGFIDEDEFGELGFDNDYGYWDDDDSGWLDSNEFYGGLYNYYDEDESGHWQGGEWDDAGEEGLFDL